MTAASEFRAGWRNLTAATVGMGFGVSSYTAVSSLFFQPLRAEFGWTSSATAGALIALPLTAAALGAGHSPPTLVVGVLLFGVRIGAPSST